MKIVQLIYTLFTGGAERFVASLSNELAAKGHDVTVCMLLSDKNPEYLFNRQYLDDKVKFVALNFEPGFSLNKVKRVEKFILSVQPDVVHCHLNVVPYIYRLSLKSKNIKFIHTLHSVAENTSSGSIQRLINRHLYRKGRIVPVTISEKCRQSYMKFYNLPSPVSIDNGCGVPFKSSSYDEVVSEVASYKSNKNTPVFIHVSRYHELKNQSLLIGAFNELYNLGVDFTLLVLGDRYDDAFMASACKNVHFLGLKSNVADYLYCADAFCLTSIHEGLPISLLEALACGVVPICTNVGGIPDVIKNDSIGLLSEVDLNSYVGALQKFLSSSWDKENLRDIYNKCFSMEACVNSYMAVYADDRLSD